MPAMPFSHQFIPKKGGSASYGFAILLAFVTFVAGLAIGLGQGLRAAQQPGSQVLTGDASGTALTGAVTGIGSRPPSGLARDVDFQEFWDVWRDLKSDFVHQPVSDMTLFYGAMKGMAESLDDPYTAYFEPTDAEEFMNSLKGEFSGIGAEIGVKSNQLQIISPLPDSPAEKAGVRARDLILKIDGEDSIDMPVNEAVMKIRGPKGTDVTLTLGRLGKDENGQDTLDTLDVTIHRDTIQVKSVKLEKRDNGIYVMAIRAFNDDVADEFAKAVDQVIAGGAKGLVIDVRNNPGGYLDKAVTVTGEWVKDEIVVQQREQGRIKEQYRGSGRGLLRDIPTVVLVNEGSASAAEILAGALQDYKLASVVGKQTFGKGSVQDLRNYDDGGALKVTIAEWLTPNGRSIDKEGIMPDIDVDLTPEDFNADKDPQLEKALELLKTK